MNRLQYWLTADTQYNIQSPFLYELYSEVIAPRLDKSAIKRHGIDDGDTFAQIRHKLMDHYAATPCDAEGWKVDCLLDSGEVGMIGLMRNPHGDRCREELWRALTARDEVTLSVDLFDVGILFTNKKLSRQSVVLRCI